MIKGTDEVIRQADVMADLFYITGWSVKSPLFRKAVQLYIGDIEVVDGDHFGSVANGLTIWANKIYIQIIL